MKFMNTRDLLQKVEASALAIREGLAEGHPDSIREARGEVEVLLGYLATIEEEIGICGLNFSIHLGE